MLARRLLIHIVEKRHGGLLQGPGARRLQLALPQLREVSPLLPIHGRWIPQPVIFGPGQAFISFRFQLLVFPATYPIHRFPQMLGDMKFIEHYLLLGFAHMFPHRLYIGIPHVHGHRGNAVALLLGKGGPESVQTLLLPTFGHVQHAVMGQIVHQGQVLVPLAEGFFVHPQVRDLLRLALGLNRAPLPVP